MAWYWYVVGLFVLASLFGKPKRRRRRRRRKGAVSGLCAVLLGLIILPLGIIAAFLTAPPPRSRSRAGIGPRRRGYRAARPRRSI